MADDDIDGVQAISSLGEPSRRALYEAISRDGGWVSRDQASAATGIERSAASHHLDRLVADGLLEVDYRRLTGRTGPGAGRPAKLYRRAERDFDVSLPPRDYRLAGKLLARAVDAARSTGGDVVAALGEEAAKEGARWAEAIRARLRGDQGRRAVERRRAIVETLDTQGFEPSTDERGCVTLRNCPFDYLAGEHTELICGMNLALLRSTLDEVGRSGLTARLEPHEERCCVTLHPR